MGHDSSAHGARTTLTTTASPAAGVVNSKATSCQSFVPEGAGGPTANRCPAASKTSTVSVATLFKSSVRTK